MISDLSWTNRESYIYGNVHQTPAACPNTKKKTHRNTHFSPKIVDSHTTIPIKCSTTH